MGRSRIAASGSQVRKAAFIWAVAIALSMAPTPLAQAATGEPEWSAIGLFGFGASAIVPSPNYVSDDTVFTASRNKGSYKSIDRGQSWVAGNAGNGEGCWQLAVAPGYPADKTMFCGGHSSVYRSLSGGSSWDVTSNGLPSSIYYGIGDIAVTPNFSASKTLFVFAESDVYRSVDAGNLWTVTSMGLSVRDIEVSPGYALDQTLFVATGSGVYRSTDGGNNWKSRNTGLTNTDVLSIAASRTFATDHTLFAATTAGLFRSTDGGANWKYSGASMKGVRIDAVVLSPNYRFDHVVLVVSRGTVYISTDGGNRWRKLDSGLPSSPSYTVAAAPTFSKKHTLFAANESAFYSVSLKDIYAPRVSAPRSAKGAKGKTVKLYYKVKDTEASWVKATIQLETKRGKLLRRIAAGWKHPGKLTYMKYKVNLKPGTYYFEVYSKDKAGNSQLKVARNKLVVPKSKPATAAATAR